MPRTTLEGDMTSLFSQPWFKWRAEKGIALASQGDTDAIDAWETKTLCQLFIHLLDQKKSGAKTANDELLAFFAFCANNITASRSQIFQDLWVAFMSGQKRGGFFVEFGACDGLQHSNTYYLAQELGWAGILAEPNPVWHKDLKKNRSDSRLDLRCVFTSSKETLPFLCTEADAELSRIESIVPQDIHEKNGTRNERARIDVETVSLIDLLLEHDAPQIIDYLSIDTEGSEFEILEAFDFSRFSFRLISCEHAGDKAKLSMIKKLLEKHDYDLWHPEASRWDAWFVNRNL